MNKAAVIQKQAGNSRNNLSFSIIIILFFLTLGGPVFSQNSPVIKTDSLTGNSQLSSNEKMELKKQRDLVDLFLLWILKKNPDFRVDSNKKDEGRLHFSGAPSPSYSLATGLAVNFTGSTAFYAGDREKTNISSVLIAPLYTIKKQFSLPLQFSIWTKGNKYNLVGDWRFMTYPEATYGLGGGTLPSDSISMNYHYIRAYTFILKTIRKNFYAGLGYQYDYHWNIRQLNVPPNTVTSVDKYGYNNNSTSSGLSADILYDDRKNSLNPEAGSTYANIVFRQNLKAIASDGNWNSLLVDIRKYFRLNDHTSNVLAFWSYNYLTLSGNPPYMDLPSTGWDTYGNTGRGYVQSRFRSREMVDLEGEYRFRILNNGLLGGVVFGNLQSYAEWPSNHFQYINPGYGAGLRIKFNKFSRTNICLDYAFGQHGSNGLFVNLGEVF